MKLYRVHYYEFKYGSRGYEYFTNKATATKVLRRWVKVNDVSENEIAEMGLFAEIEVTPTKQGIIDALNCYGAHPNNG